ncbi:chemotaxis protein CheW [Vagococcus silagei]|uniref:Chemotaxis protein CheW n=1 Tax=Vagococcus silagei TaxID=2508885 RepID=A0A4S3B3C4_9ENTE|nr:chemotaxis protein CheW [Vagococcus silagei]THB61322.1 chemotaxis protein CheW [Vagococcus silagei]
MKKQIVFKSHQQTFSLPVEQIEKIILWEQPVSVPLEQEFVLGVIKHQGHVVPVIDLSFLFYQAFTEINSSCKLIISSLNGKLISFLVEDIVGIKDFEKQQFEEVDDEFMVEKEFIEAFVKTDADIILELNLARLLDLKAIKGIELETFIQSLVDKEDA